MPRCLFAALIASQLSFVAISAIAAEPSEFTVQGARSIEERDSVLARCVALRKELHERWNGDANLPAWQPVCEIALHYCEADYLRAVGAGGKGTEGATYLAFDPKKPSRIVRRRIDLWSASGDPLAALPHELTHVILGDRFAGSPPPAWLDEGTATLADTALKQGRHLRDLRTALASRRSPSIVHTLAHEGPIPASQRAAFYGQSVAVSLVLTRLDKPARIFEFAAAVERDGAERALASIYGITPVELERRVAAVASDRELALDE